MRRYRYEMCDRCGRPASAGIGAVVSEPEHRLHDQAPHELVPSTYWFADSPLWNFVIGGPDATDDPGGVRCPRCFEGEARAKGIHIGWRAGRVGDLE